MIKGRDTYSWIYLIIYGTLNITALTRQHSHCTYGRSVLSGQLLFDLVHNAFLLAGALGAGGVGAAGVSLLPVGAAGVSLLPVGAAGRRRGVLVVLVASGQLLLDLLLDSLLPPSAHAVVLRL